ncbi:putative phytol kinase 2, chloroplastic [Canna indica]|uniref:Phytol kinase 2, chloroplastic n=1 Tax=Canna indica TaxID=4628 RepID=A0AAQ3QD64_9LILI|nr:putative phytol kinase 2, chloroplastic [Canna indica]
MVAEFSLPCHALLRPRSATDLDRHSPPSFAASAAAAFPSFLSTSIRSAPLPHLRVSSRARRWQATTAATMMPESSLVHDLGAAAVTSAVALLLLRFWEELAKRGVFEQKLSRKLVHISIGLVFMLLWPLFSPGSAAPFLAALAPGINIIRMLLLGLGIWKNDAMVKSMSRSGDHRELLKGPLYYACTIAIATSIFWRTSPIAIAAICNLCAGDGVADIVGRRLGMTKLPYNRNKSLAGSIAMFLAGFLSSIGYMHYYHMFGFMDESWGMITRFFVVSLFAAIVESLPISSELDDNLTVPVASLLVGALVF